MIRTYRSAVLASLFLSGVAFAKANEGGSGAPTVPPALGSEAPAAAATATAGTVSGILKGLTMPEKKKSARGGGKSPYPFDGLAVGEAFGVVGKEKKNFNSIIYGQHQKYAVPVIDPATGQPRKVLKITYQRDPADKKKYAKDTNGNKIETGREMVDETRETRQFEAFDVDPKTNNGFSVLVFRQPDAVAPAAS